VNAVAQEGQDMGTGDGRFPAASRIGHVHLKVGDAAVAEQFYTHALGLDVMARRRPAAVFMASGGYHHHIAANTWMSHGTGNRPAGALGLSELQLAVTDTDLSRTITDRMGGASFTDPWGNRLKVA
jgi:catechol 2,3-dioxygenase